VVHHLPTCASKVRGWLVKRVGTAEIDGLALPYHQAMVFKMSRSLEVLESRTVLFLRSAHLEPLTIHFCPRLRKSHTRQAVSVSSNMVSGSGRDGREESARSSTTHRGRQHENAQGMLPFLIRLCAKEVQASDRA
jgi:hypothetical protein